MCPTRLSFLSLLLIAAGTLYGQTWQWAGSGEGSGNANGFAVAADAQGNSVVAGTYNGTIGLGGQVLSTLNEDGLFLAKYDPDGALLWAHIAANAAGITVNGITVDDAGSIALVGMYKDTVAFIPGPVGTSLISAGAFDVFVVEYASDGSPLWARSIGDTGYDYGASIAHDGVGNIYVTGDLHQYSFNLSPSKIFVSKFATDGTLLWTTFSADYGNSHLGDGISTSGTGEVCITGEFFGSLTLGAFTLDAGTAEATIYVAKLNSSGVPVWAQKAGEGGYAVGESVDMDAQGNAYITGFYRGNIALGDLFLPGPGDPSYDVFVAKCANADGAFQWATSGTGPGSDRAVGIRVDAAGNSYFNGSYQESWTFGNTTLETNGGVDGYVAKLSPSGEPLWAKDYGGPTGDFIGGLALSGTDVFVTGGFQVAMQFDPGPTLSGQPIVHDVFVAKLTDVPSGIEEVVRPQYTIYPDPASDRIQLGGLLGRCTYTVLDEQGRAVLSGEASAEVGIDVSNLASGSYVLALGRINGSPLQRHKFVKY